MPAIKGIIFAGILHHLVVTPGLAGDAPVAATSVFHSLVPRWQDAMTALDAPGVAVVVVRGDEVLLLDGWGIRDPRSSAPVNPDTMFYIASCTKPYTAAGVTILQDEGKLTWDDTIRAHLPRVRLSDEELGSRLTLRDLACHRHGLNHPAIVFADAFSGEFTEDTYYALLSAASIARRVAYSNVHFTLLGRVIESASGMSWRDFLERRLFLPAGMTRTTGYASRMYSDGNVAFPLVREKDEWVLAPLLKTDRTMHAAGGLGTTARDLGRWMRLNLNRGRLDDRRVVSESGMESMFARQSDAPPRGKTAKLDAFGLGWMLGNYRGRPMIAHGGGYLAASAYVTMLPEEKIGVAVLVNSSAPGAGVIEIISYDVLDHLLGMPAETDLLPTMKKKARQLLNARREREAGLIPVTADRLSLPIEQYVGSYAHPDWGAMEIVQTDGRLGLRAGDLRMYLHSRAVDQFEARTYSADDGHDGMFDVAEGGVPAMLFAPTGDPTVRFKKTSAR